MNSEDERIRLAREWCDELPDDEMSLVVARAFLRIQQLLAYIDEQQEAVAAERTKYEELINALEDYIDLLKREISEMSGIARAHGWESIRVDEGTQARGRIIEAKAAFIPPIENFLAHSADAIRVVSEETNDE